MSGRLRAALVATTLCLAAAGGAVLATASPAAADTGSCVSYLESIGEDTIVRVQICAETETIGDTVSQEVALQFCVPAMRATLLSLPNAVQACHLAVAPS